MCDSHFLWFKTYLKFDALSAEISLPAPVKSNDDNKYGAKLFRLLRDAYLSRGTRMIQLLIASRLSFKKGRGKIFHRHADEVKII